MFEPFSLNIFMVEGWKLEENRGKFVKKREKAILSTPYPRYAITNNVFVIISNNFVNLKNMYHIFMQVISLFRKKECTI